MNRKRLETYEWINTEACKLTLEERLDLTQDEREWLNDRIVFLNTPAEATIRRLRDIKDRLEG